MYKKFALLVASGSILIFLFHPGRHARYYSYIEVQDIYDELFQSNFLSDGNKSFCKDKYYKTLIENSQQLDIDYVLKYQETRKVLAGGEYVPSDCISRFRIAIIVPYRNREEHLTNFLNYMHKFLQIQDIHYKIYVVEQTDNFPFNRGKLLNIGALEAIKNNFTCLFLHDVDLLPINSGHIYACSKIPRHLAGGMDTFRYHLPYLEFTGGVFSIKSEQYQRINGMSNRFEGWGGEDDDFHVRLASSGLVPCRFPPVYNKYHMLRHKKAVPSETRWKELKSALNKKQADGLNSFQSYDYKVIKKRLFTHILV